MSSPEIVPVTPAVPPPPPWSWKSTLVCIFVTFHLFILAFRNPLDLWWKEMEGYAKETYPEQWKEYLPYYRTVDRWTERYENVFGIEQGWCMFAPPLARAAPFLATRLEFDNGEEEIILSANEPTPGQDYFRIGGWRQRKLEDKLAYTSVSSLPEERDLPLWPAYVRWRVRGWREAHPDDPRQIVKVELMRRRIEFPTPENETHYPGEPEGWVVGQFNPDGSLP